MSAILDVKNLSVTFQTPKKLFQAVNQVSFSLGEEETLGIVGESGCGKSVTSLSLMGLLPRDTARISSGELIYNGEDLLKLSKGKRRQLRGGEMAMIFQDPLSSLDPLYTIEKQMAEGMRKHLSLSKKEIKDKSRRLLSDVGIQEPERILSSYPHELSGGMIQRVMIAIGLACNPKILIADEPTTALDVTVQAQVLALMNRLRKQHQTSIILITHNMGVVAEMCDRVLVMYAGEIVEEARVEDLFENPSHPYTKGLLTCIPTLGEMPKELPVIPGMVPSADETITGCLFSPRCPFSMERCKKEHPDMVSVTQHHLARCFLCQQ